MRRHKSKQHRLNQSIALLRYDAVEQNTTNRPIYVSSRSEDAELDAWRRQRLVSAARDQIRNFTMAGFVLRKHLQFVAYYRFSANTPYPELNAELERRVKRWKRRDNCDAACRFSFDELCNLWESHRALDGDVGIAKLSNGRLQIIEGDRIRNPEPLTDYEREGSHWVHGVKINEWGQPLAYAVSSRLPGGGFKHERIIPARNFYLLGYFQRRDQTRGVSLSAPAIRLIASLYESIELALAKQKLEQVLGLKTNLRQSRSIGAAQQTTDADRQAGIEHEVHEVFGPGILHLKLYEDEQADIISSNNPSSNFQAFCEKVLQMIFASYDIPYSFADGSKTNFYGSRGEFEQYMDSVERKQQMTREMLDDLTCGWLVPLWMNDESRPLVLPSGVTPDDLRDWVSWSGAGMPAWRLYEYIKDCGVAANLGLISLKDTASEYGMDIKKNLADNAALVEFAKSLGLSMPVGTDTAVNLGM